MTVKVGLVGKTSDSLKNKGELCNQCHYGCHDWLGFLNLAAGL